MVFIFKNKDIIEIQLDVAVQLKYLLQLIDPNMVHNYINKNLHTNVIFFKKWKYYSESLGIYHYTSDRDHNGRPVYLSKRRPIKTLYYFNNEYWVVKQKNEKIKHLANYAPKGPDSICPDKTKSTWRYRNNHQWHLDKTLSVNCIGKKYVNNRRSEEIPRSHEKSGKNRKTLTRHDDSDNDSRFSKCGMISWERFRLPKKKKSQRVWLKDLPSIELIELAFWILCYTLRINPNLVFFIPGGNW